MLPMPIGSVYGSVKLFVIKNAPTLLVAGGTALMAASTGLAVKASFDSMNKVIVPHIVKTSEIDADETMSEDEKETAKDELKKQTAVDTAKTFLPAVGVMIAGIACIAAGHTMQLKRLAGLSAALAAVKLENEQLKADAAGEEIEPVTVTHEGKTDVVRTEVDGHLLPVEDFRNRVFGPENKNWDPAPVVCENFLNAVERHANDQLRWKGHLFLNEVYKMLGMPETRLGAVMGWSKKADPNVMVLLSSLRDETGLGDDNIQTVWHLDLDAPHNLVA